MEAFLAAKARTLEDAENRMNKLYYKWLGLKEDPARVHYPEKFDIMAPQDIVDLFTKVTLNAISGTLNKEMAKRLVHQVLPHAEDSIIEKIYNEIDTNERLEDPTLLNEPRRDVPSRNSPFAESELKKLVIRMRINQKNLYQKLKVQFQMREI